MELIFALFEDGRLTCSGYRSKIMQHCLVYFDLPSKAFEDSLERARNEYKNGSGKGVGIGIKGAELFAIIEV